MIVLLTTIANGGEKKNIQWSLFKHQSEPVIDSIANNKGIIKTVNYLFASNKTNQLVAVLQTTKAEKSRKTVNDHFENNTKNHLLIVSQTTKEDKQIN